MRSPIPSLRRPTIREILIGLRLVLVLLLAAVGALLLTDQHGLRAEYFALGGPWEGKPLTTAVGEPRLEDVSQVGAVLNTIAVFSIRWSGWWEVAQKGEHRFLLDADDGGYLRIDDELVVDTSGAVGKRQEAGRKALAAGFHAVEIGLYQTDGDSRLALRWVAPRTADAAAACWPLVDLFAERPLLPRKILRRALAPWPRAYRQLLGAFLLLVALSLLHGLARRFERGVAWLRTWLRAIDGRGLRMALLLGLFVLAFLAAYPFTGAVRGGDDTSYLNTATFTSRQWYFNRYGHVYLLKLFVTLSGGDPLVGVRVWWSFAFAATVAALAVAVRSVGPGLQLRTMVATLLVLLAQPPLFGMIGAGFADYSAMMFITVAVAIYLSGVAFDRERPPPRREWRALAIGVLTVGAFRSKEVGAVLLVLPLLFLIGPGSSLDLRRFVRKMAYWAAGAVGALLVLMLLDGWFLGDFFFTVDPRRFLTLEKMNFPAEVALRRRSWLNKIWNGEAMRNLWVGVAASALAAGICRRRLELRLMHLLPIAYLVALIALYVRLPHPFSNRMLIPVLPVACLMTGLLLHYAGLDEVSWRELLSPAVLIPSGLAIAVVYLVALPYRLGTVEAAGLLPGDVLRRYGWEPELFAVGVLLPAAVLIALGAVALVAGQRRARVAALLVAYVALFGFGFEQTRTSLAQKRAVQTGELLLYPWRTFRGELNALTSPTIALSRDLQFRYQMSATPRTSLARLALVREDVHVVRAGALPANVDVAIASREAYAAWLTKMPALAATATYDRNGFLVLVRPKQAVEQQRTTAGPPPG